MDRVTKSLSREKQQLSLVSNTAAKIAAGINFFVRVSAVV